MILAVTGSRGWSNQTLLFGYLDSLHARCPIARLIAGGARGADTLAEAWARSRGVPFHVCRPDYRRYGGVRGRAEMRRNYRMVQAVDQVVAFWDGHSRGTAATIQMAKEAGKLRAIIREAVRQV